MSNNVKKSVDSLLIKCPGCSSEIAVPIELKMDENTMTFSKVIVSGEYKCPVCNISIDNDNFITEESIGKKDWESYVKNQEVK